MTVILPPELQEVVSDRTVQNLDKFSDLISDDMKQKTLQKLREGEVDIIREILIQANIALDDRIEGILKQLSESGSGIENLARNQILQILAEQLRKSNLRNF